MSHKASHWLAALPPTSLHSGAFRVLFHLCDAHNDTQPAHLACFPNQATLRLKTGLSNGGLNNALNSLEEGGFLRRRKTRTSEGKKGPTYYILGCDEKANHKPSPESGDGAISSLVAKPSPLSGANHLQPTGDKPVIEPVNDPKACASKREEPTEPLQSEPIPDAHDQFEESIWPFHWRAGDNSSKAFTEFDKLSVEERAECVRAMEVAKSTICKDQPNPEYRVGLAKWIAEKRFKSLVDAALALEKSKAEIDGARTLDRFADAELFKACEMARQKPVAGSLDRYMFTKQIIDKARASL